MTAITRRDLVHTAALLGTISGTTVPLSAFAQARNSFAIAINRDIQGVLSPPFRTSYQENNIIRAVMEGLIRFKPSSFEWELSAASRIQQASDTVIEFELKPGRMFHGGFGEMTAEDVKWSFESFREPGPDGKLSTYSKDWEPLDHVEVTGEYTGKILLKSPAPQLWLVVLPDGSGLIYSKKARDAGAYKTDQQPVQVIGTGPYTFAEWVPNQRIVLRANPQFAEFKPAFEEIIVRPVRDPKTGELALRADELQFATVEPASADAFEKVADTKVIRRDSINFVWIGMNVEKPPLNDPRVRQAIRAALDVEQILAGAYDGAVGPAYGPVAPGLLGYWKDAPHYGRDVAKAKELLSQAGLASGLKTRLTLLNRPVFQNVGLVAQAMLAEAGIQLDLDILDGGAFWSMGNGDAGKNLELSLQRFGGKADPAFQMQWFVADQIGEWNWQRWNSPDYDRLFAEANSTADADKRAALYIQMQKLMDESAAYVWLTHERNIFAYRSWLRPAILPNGDDQLYAQFAKA